MPFYFSKQFVRFVIAVVLTVVAFSLLSGFSPRSWQFHITVLSLVPGSFQSVRLSPLADRDALPLDLLRSDGPVKGTSLLRQMEDEFAVKSSAAANVEPVAAFVQTASATAPPAAQADTVSAMLHCLLLLFTRPHSQCAFASIRSCCCCRLSASSYWRTPRWISTAPLATYSAR